MKVIDIVREKGIKECQRVKIIDNLGQMWTGEIIHIEAKEWGDDESSISFDDDGGSFIGFYDGDIESIEVIELIL